MQENSYIQVLIQSLHQKVEALDSIIEKNQEQYEILSAEEADMDAFEKNIDEKSQYIDKIVFLDDGFEEIYTRVKEELDGNRAAYTEEIQKMKDLISMITERSMKIQVQEQRNKELAGMQFSKARKKIRQVKAGNKAASRFRSSATKSLQECSSQRHGKRYVRSKPATKLPHSIIRICSRWTQSLRSFWTRKSRKIKGEMRL